MIVGQGPIALAVGAGEGFFGNFSFIYIFSFLSPSLWGTARYRLKYCFKGPLNPKQPTNYKLFNGIFVNICILSMSIFIRCGPVFEIICNFVHVTAASGDRLRYARS